MSHVCLDEAIQRRTQLEIVNSKQKSLQFFHAEILFVTTIDLMCAFVTLLKLPSTHVICLSNLTTTVTHFDQMGTKSLGISGDNWRRHHLGVINLLFLIFFIITMQSVYSIILIHSPFWPINDFKTHFELQHLLGYSVNRFSPIFSKWPPYV